jgi:hypothetical protein
LVLANSFLDPSAFNGDFYEQDSWAFSSEEEAEVAEGELKSWFLSPEEEKVMEIGKDREKEETPDLFTKLYQELADEEYARELVRNPSCLIFSCFSTPTPIFSLCPLFFFLSTLISSLKLKQEYNMLHQPDYSKSSRSASEKPETVSEFLRRDLDQLPYCPPAAYHSGISTYNPAAQFVCFHFWLF